eukprot:gene44934-60867_t
MPHARLLRNLLHHTCAADRRAGTTRPTAALIALVVCAAFAMPAHSGLLDGLDLNGNGENRSASPFPAFPTLSRRNTEVPYD